MQIPRMCTLAGIVLWKASLLTLLAHSRFPYHSSPESVLIFIGPS